MIDSSTDSSVTNSVCNSVGGSLNRNRAPSLRIGSDCAVVVPVVVNGVVANAVVPVVVPETELVSQLQTLEGLLVGLKLVGESLIGRSDGDSSEVIGD